jgi:hypothetical protein
LTGIIAPGPVTLVFVLGNPHHGSPCKQEQASIQQQLELMESGKVQTGENRGTGWVDTTAESVERAKARLAELDSLVTESGPVTVTKTEGAE